MVEGTDKKLQKLTRLSGINSELWANTTFVPTQKARSSDSRGHNSSSLLPFGHLARPNLPSKLHQPKAEINSEKRREKIPGIKATGQEMPQHQLCQQGAGDWGVGHTPEVINPSKSRSKVHTILQDNHQQLHILHLGTGKRGSERSVSQDQQTPALTRAGHCIMSKPALSCLQIQAAFFTTAACEQAQVPNSNASSSMASTGILGQLIYAKVEAFTSPQLRHLTYRDESWPQSTNTAETMLSSCTDDASTYSRHPQRGPHWMPDMLQQRPSHSS